MRVAVDKLLEEAGGSLVKTFRPKPADLAYEEIEFAEKHIRVTVDLQNAGGDLLGKVHVKCHLMVECSRCLERYVYAISAERQIRYLQHLTEEALRDEMGGWFVSEFDGETVVLNEDVRQILLLALPFQPLCHEDCRGLCPSCGSNLNQGPCACPTRPKPLGENPFRAAFDQLRRRREK